MQRQGRSGAGSSRAWTVLGDLQLQPSLEHVTARRQLHVPVLGLLSPESIRSQWGPMGSGKDWSAGTLPTLGAQAHVLPKHGVLLLNVAEGP